MDGKMTKHDAWQLTADAAVHYERSVARYIVGPWAPLLADAARLNRGEHVLDVACGTGVVARIAAERVGADGRVVAIDLNPEMIAVARSLPAPAGAPIEWLERSALDLRLEDAAFDVVLCQQGVQFFPDKVRALQEMRRVLRKGGRLALSVWNNTGIYNGAVAEALARFVDSEAAGRFCASRQAPTKEELHHYASQAGFSRIEVRIERLNIHLPCPAKFALAHLASTPISAVIAAAGADVRQQIGASVSERLRLYADGDGITYPEETRVLTARVL
jgi:ubiquinone/menaquinone biosynthesis C-methylase UbiE